MHATFTFRGREYTVSGWLWASDGAGNSIIVRRDDGELPRGSKMHPGMVQTGLSPSLERAAIRALESKRAAGRDQ